jgi:hypothetical protein
MAVIRLFICFIEGLLGFIIMLSAFDADSKFQAILGIVMFFHAVSFVVKRGE